MLARDSARHRPEVSASGEDPECLSASPRPFRGRGKRDLGTCSLERDEFSFDFRRHCERSEAISSSRCSMTVAGDCFASLAMTIRSNLIPPWSQRGGPPALRKADGPHPNPSPKGRGLFPFPLAPRLRGGRL